ncbi:unnamed protein product, partial [marine sediment metagenome]
DVYYDISSEVWDAIDWIGDKIADSYSSVKSIVTDGFHYVTDYTYAVINDVGVAIGRATDYAVDKIKSALGWVKDGIVNLATKVWDGITDAGAWVSDAVKSGFYTVKDCEPRYDCAPCAHSCTRNRKSIVPQICNKTAQILGWTFVHVKAIIKIIMQKSISIVIHDIHFNVSVIHPN